MKIPSKGGWTLYSLIFNGVNSALNTNFTYVDVTNTGPNAMGQLILGEANNQTLGWDGKIAAFLAYNQALGTNNWTWVAQSLNTKFGLGLTVTSNGYDAGSMWANRVVKNGGAAPSDNSRQTVAAFCTNLISYALYNTNWGAISLMATDSVTAALTPQVAGRNITDPWVNHSFVAGDLSTNGLKGDGSSKYIDTGIAVQADNISLTSIGLCLYLYATNGNQSGQLDFGNNNGLASGLELFPSVGNVSDFSAWNFNTGQGRAQVTTSGNGFYVGSRTSSSASSIYFAKNGTTFGAIKTIATSGGVQVTVNMYLFNESNNGSPTVGGYSSDTISTAGIFRGLTINESSNLFTCVQTARTNWLSGFR